MRAHFDIKRKLLTLEDCPLSDILDNFQKIKPNKIIKGKIEGFISPIILEKEDDEFALGVWYSAKFGDHVYFERP